MNGDYINILAEGLSGSGIRRCFGVTGSGMSLKLIAALAKHKVCYYPVAHEGAAAIMAGACCRGGRSCAMAISIKGPGFANFVPGILSNFYENRPAVTISEAYGDDAPPYRAHKRLDHRSLSAAVTKGYLRGDVFAGSIKSLLTVAEEEVPGPVHVDMCGGTSFMAEAGNRESDESEDNIEVVLDNIKKSSRPVLLLGSVAARKIPGFAWQAARIPVATTPAAKGSIDENNVYAAGVFTGEGKELSVEEMVLAKADCIVGIGLRNNEVVKAAKAKAPLAIIDVISGRIHDGFGADYNIKVNDLARAAASVCTALSDKQWGEDIVGAYHSEVRQELFSHSWLPAIAFDSLKSLAPDASIIVVDTGLFCTVAETIWRAGSPDDFCGSSNGRFMGTGIPTAIGVAVSSPKRPVICVCGDGGVRPYFPEIRLAVEHKLPVLFLLMSDGAYGTILSSASPDMPVNAFMIHGVSWWRAAEAIGCPAFSVSDKSGYERALKQWDTGSGPLFIELSFNAQDYSEMTKRLR